MIPQILAFLKELKQNNNRPWFQQNKARYDSVRQAYTDIVQELLNRIALFDPDIAGLQPKDCLFRIYRDIRFSPDKSPYKTHFGAYIAAAGGKNSQRSGYYFHLEPSNSLCSGGLWRPHPALLKQIRQDIYHNIDEFLAILNYPSFKALYPHIDGDMLKRLPQSFPANFPNEDLLRYKDFCITKHLPDRFFADKHWIDKAAACFKQQLPFHRFLNYTVDNLTNPSTL